MKLSKSFINSRLKPSSVAVQAVGGNPEDSISLKGSIIFMIFPKTLLWYLKGDFT